MLDSLINHVLIHLGIGDIGAHLSWKKHLQGKTYFYQSEFKYTMGVHSEPHTWDHVPHAVTWLRHSRPVKGGSAVKKTKVSYRLNAENHIAMALGIYAAWRKRT